MTVKIDNSIKGVPSQGGNTAGTRAVSVPPQAPVAQLGPVAAQVEISRTSAHLVDGDNFNAARVAEIRQAISEGRFEINPERIADGLLQSVRDFLADRRQSEA